MRSVMQVASLTLFTLAAVCLSAPAMAGRGLTVVVVTDTCSTSARTGRLMEPRSSRLPARCKACYPGREAPSTEQGEPPGVNGGGGAPAGTGT